jgi:hypothetical protein
MSDNLENNDKKRKLEMASTIELMEKEMDRERIRYGIKLTMLLNKFQNEFNELSLDLKKVTIFYILNYFETMDDSLVVEKNEIIKKISEYEVTYDNKNISNINWSFLTKYFNISCVADLLYIVTDL